MHNVFMVDNNRPVHKNPKKNKAERQRAREALAARVQSEARRLEAAREYERRRQEESKRDRYAREIRELEKELWDSAGFSKITQRRLASRLRQMRLQLEAAKAAWKLA